MSTEVGELTIEPDFEGKQKPIHPALDMVDGHAYVGVWVPCRITSKKGKVTTKHLPFVVRDDGQRILANDVTLRALGLRLAYRPEEFENRWGLKYVQNFVDAKSIPDPQSVLDKIIQEYVKFIEFMDPRDHIYHSLWDVGSYFYHLFNAYPYLYLGGVKRSAKTKTLTLHSLLAFNAIFSGNMSTSSIFRLVQNARATLLVDENEKLRDPNRLLDFRQLFLSGYKRGAGAYRVDKDSAGVLHPKRFELYSPKGVANIRGLEDVLADRCKPTTMRWTNNRKIGDREIDTQSEHWGELRDELYRLYLGYWKEIRAKYGELGELSEHNELVNFLQEGYIGAEDDLKHLSSRELELWKPVFALAMFFDAHVTLKKMPSLDKFTCSLSSLTSCMIGLAVDCAKEKNVESMTESGEVLLASVLLKDVDHNDYYPIKNLRASMQKLYDEDQKWLTTRWVGNALRRLGFKEKRRVGTGYQYKLNVADVTDLASRMGVGQEPASGSELPQVDLMRLLGELHQKVGGANLTSEKFLSVVITNFPNEQEGRLRKAVQEMIDHAVLFRISEGLEAPEKPKEAGVKETTGASLAKEAEKKKKPSPPPAEATVSVQGAVSEQKGLEHSPRVSIQEIDKVLEPLQDGGKISREILADTLGVDNEELKRILVMPQVRGRIIDRGAIIEGK